MNRFYTRMKLCFTILIIFFFYGITFAQTFPCDGSFYISLNNTSSPTFTFKINHDGNNIIFDEITTTFAFINSIGYNPKDNFIYAVNRNNNDIIKLTSDGTFEVVGEEPTINKWVSGAGDCSSEGIYAVQDLDSKDIFFYDLNEPFSFLSKVSLEWDENSGNQGKANIHLDDMVFDPNDPTILYTFQKGYIAPSEPQNTQGALLIINADFQSRDFGKVSVVGSVPSNVIRHIGALFFDSYGELFAYGSLQVSPVNQNRLVSINKLNAEAELIDVGPGAQGNDGCSCPFSIELNNAISESIIKCDSTILTYSYDLFNNSFQDMSGFTFTNNLPENASIISIEGHEELNGTISSNSGVGTNSLIIENCSIDKKTLVQFHLQVKIPTSAGTIVNQAMVDDLNSPFDFVLVSNDPNTPAFDDATVFELSEQDIQQGTSSFSEITICEGETITVNGNLYSEPGQIVEVIPFGASNGCDSTIIVDLNVNVCNAIVGISNNSNLLCHGDDSGNITISIIEGVLPIEILWERQDSGINGTLIFDQVDQVEYINQLSAGFYNIYIVDPNNQILLETIEITEPELIEIDLNILQDISCVDLKGTLGSEVKGGTGMYTYLWSNGSTDELIENLSSGNYSLTVIDENDCSAINNITLEEFIPLSFETNANISHCNGLDNGQIIIANPNGGQGPYTYSIDGVNFQEDPTFNNLQQGEYLLQIMDSENCVSEINSVIFEKPQIPSIQEIKTEYYIDLGEQVSINLILNFDPELITWTPSHDMSCSDCLNPIFYPSETSSYQVIITDIYGCSVEKTITIRVDNEIKTYIPNAFTPNRDGRNDKVTINTNQAVKSILEFKIYDRWGEEVFCATNFQPNDETYGWDGTKNGKILNPGVFAYYVRVLSIDDKITLLKGNITLLN